MQWSATNQGAFWHFNSLFEQASSRPSPASPTPTVHSNMARRINDREFVTLARINKTPALQAIFATLIVPHKCMTNYMQTIFSGTQDC